MVQEAKKVAVGGVMAIRVDMAFGRAPTHWLDDKPPTVRQGPSTERPGEKLETRSMFMVCSHLPSLTPNVDYLKRMLQDIVHLVTSAQAHSDGTQGAADKCLATLNIQ